MKIAIVGSHGTGKSSLARGLAKKLNGCYIPDIVREEAAPKGLEINENTPPEVQLWLTARQWELEKLTPEPWVADKNLFDMMVYAEVILTSQNSEKAGKVMDVIRAVVKDNARYDFIFYLPIEFPMELDGLRSEDLEFQKEIDRRYREFLDKWGIEYIVLPSYYQESDSPAEAIKKRVNKALEFIKSKAASN